MKQMTSTRFRREYLAETEPVEVTAYEKPIGYWYPIGTQPGVEADPETVTEAAEGYRFTIRPALRPRPEMVGETKAIFDPVELRKQEQSRGDAYGSRSFTPKRKT